MSRSRIGVAWLYVLSKYGFPPDADGVIQGLDDVGRMGFRLCELESVGDANYREIHRHRERIRRKLDEYGLEVTNYIAVVPDLVAAEPERRRAGMALFAETVELASWFGSKVVQSDSFLPPVEILENPLYEDDVHFERSTRVRVPRGFDWPRYWDVVVETFAGCAEIAGDRGLRLAIEPRVGETLSNSDALLRLIDHAGSPHLGVVFDTAHLHAQRELLPLSVHKLAGRVFHVHLADNDGTTNRHAAPGTGTVDWDEVLRALDAVGYTGPLMLDIGKVDELDAAIRKGGDFVAGVLARDAARQAVGGTTP